jgi:transposase
MGVFVSVQFAVRTRVVSPTGKGARPDAKAGVDAGMRELATVVDGDDQVVVVQNPAPLRQTLAERRRVSRSLSRRIPGSRGHRQAKAKPARLDRRAVCLRRETYHRLTRWLVDTYGEIHVQDLDLAAMKRSMGGIPPCGVGYRAWDVPSASHLQGHGWSCGACCGGPLLSLIADPPRMRRTAPGGEAREAVVL